MEPYESSQPELSDTPEISSEEKNWAMLGHLLVLTGFIIPFGNIIAPLVIWLIKKDEMPFAANEAKEALNFEINITIYIIIAALLCLILIGFLILPVLLIANLVFVILAGVKANSGVPYRYPFIIRVIS